MKRPSPTAALKNNGINHAKRNKGIMQRVYKNSTDSNQQVVMSSVHISLSPLQNHWFLERKILSFFVTSILFVLSLVYRCFYHCNVITYAPPGNQLLLYVGQRSEIKLYLSIYQSISLPCERKGDWGGGGVEYYTKFSMVSLNNLNISPLAISFWYSKVGLSSVSLFCHQSKHTVKNHVAISHWKTR